MQIKNHEKVEYADLRTIYAIKSMEEARAYLNHPVLGARLVECAETVLAIEGRSASEIFGYPDDVKLRSSMTLFASILEPRPAEPQSVFSLVLDKFFKGYRDDRTLNLMGKMNKAEDSERA